MALKYITVAEALKKMLISNIKLGIYKLPTEMELCKKFQVSRQTIRLALESLEKEHLIIRRQGSGSFATGLLPDSGKNQIALLLSSNSEYLYPSFITDLESGLSSEGYMVSVYTTSESYTKEYEILTSLLKNPPRAILAEPIRSSLPTPNQELYEKLASAGATLLFLFGGYPNLSNNLCIREDNIMGGYLLGQQLLLQKHTQIACILKMDDIQGPERLLGLTKALREQGLTCPDEAVTWFTTENYQALQKKQDTGFLSDFIRRMPASCSAVFCYNDEIAYWLIRVLSYAGIHVPDDISVVSFDNSYLSDISVPKLATLSHKPHETADVVTEILCKRLRGEKADPALISWQFFNKGSLILHE